MRPLDDQNVALRLVVLIDRLYDRKVPVIASGTPLGDLFTPELLRGGYRKKYLRAHLPDHRAGPGRRGAGRVPSRPASARA